MAGHISGSKLHHYRAQQYLPQSFSQWLQSQSAVMFYAGISNDTKLDVCPNLEKSCHREYSSADYFSEYENKNKRHTIKEKSHFFLYTRLSSLIFLHQCTHKMPPATPIKEPAITSVKKCCAK